MNTETITVQATGTEFAGTMRDRSAREHAERIGGVVVAAKTPAPEVWESVESWMNGGQPVAIYVAAR